MGNLKLFTVSIALVLMGSCGSEKTEEASNDSGSVKEEPEIIQGGIDGLIDSTEFKLIYGTWQLIQINDQPISEGHALHGLKQTFMPDRAWFISSPKPDEDSVTLVEGGRWSFDINSRQVNILFTADSIPKTILLQEINQKKMMVQTLEGVDQAWSKIADKD